MPGSKKTKFYLFLVLAFAFLIRVYKLSSIPSGFFCDETERGVSAYWLLKTGRDWHGKQWPIFFEAFGEYSPPIQAYSLIPSIALFGLNEFSVRLASAIWGTLAVFLIFLLGKTLGSQKLGLWSSLFLAIQPWSFHYSRYGGEFITYMTFFLLALIFQLEALKKEKFWPLAFLAWGLTFYTYHPAKLITPLFLFSFLIFYFNQTKNKKFILQGLVVFIIIILPFASHMFSGAGFIRFKQVSIFSNNQPGQLFFTRYLEQLSPLRLFLKGENTFISRHLTKGLSPLLFTQFFLIFLGVAYLLKLKKHKKLFLTWIVLYPLGGALTASGPTSSRSIIGAPLFALLSGYGMLRAKKWLGKKAVIVILAIMLLNFFSFYRFYLKEYPKISADFWGWQYGPKEIIQYFLQVENQYDELIMDGNFNAPEIFFKFYAPHGCQKCKIGDINLLDRRKKQLFALPPDNLVNLNYQLKKTIYYPNGQAAFKIVEFNQ